MYSIGFILEQTLGHRTHSQNLQHIIPNHKTIQPRWGEIAWETTGLASHLPVYRSNWTVRAGLRTRRTIAAMQRQQPLDALFIHTQVPAVLNADWIQRLPTVISLDATPRQYDGLGAHYDHRPGMHWLEQLKWQLHRYSLLQARHLVTWSSWAKQSLVDDYAIPQSKITVIPPGVNVRLWYQPIIRKPSNQVVKILFVGGDFYRKGGEDLLSAFRHLRDNPPSNQNVELHLVTRKAIAAERGVTVYNDLQPNSDRLKALFHAADIFCLPTAGDCLPMVLAEAGASELPLVATDVGAIGEIVRDGETGFLVQPGDVAALEASLRRLVRNVNLRTQLGVNAAALIRQYHDAQQNTQQLLTLLKAVADMPTRQPDRWQVQGNVRPISSVKQGK